MSGHKSGSRHLEIEDPSIFYASPFGGRPSEGQQNINTLDTRLYIDQLPSEPFMQGSQSARAGPQPLKYFFEISKSKSTSSYFTDISTWDPVSHPHHSRNHLVSRPEKNTLSSARLKQSIDLKNSYSNLSRQSQYIDRFSQNPNKPPNHLTESVLVRHHYSRTNTNPDQEYSDQLKPRHFHAQTNVDQASQIWSSFIPESNS